MGQQAQQAQLEIQAQRRNWKYRHKGATGADGVADTLSLGALSFCDKLEDAKIVDRSPERNHVFDFVLPAISGQPGEKGEKGDKGDQGEKGDKGDQGEKGDQGVTGATGPQGARGATGATGPQGERGSQGEQGPQGPQGVMGATGATGATGPASVEALYSMRYDGNTGAFFNNPQTILKAPDSAECLVFDNDTITIQEGGYYEIFMTTTCDTTTLGSTLYGGVVLQVNGDAQQDCQCLIPNSKYAILVAQQVFQFNAGDTLKIKNGNG